MAKIESFPSCCTARVLVDFGESEVADWGDHEVTTATMKSSIKRQIESWRSYGIAMLTATTNNEQPTANKVLRDLGFKHSKWMSKDIHPETKVRLWWLPLK